MKKFINAIPVIIAGGLLFIVAGQFSEARSDNSQARQSYVQTICDKAHGEINGASEQACGDAQSETNTEYLCSQTGARCWVEVK